MLHLKQPVVKHSCLYSGLQVCPQGYFSTVQRRLLHDGKRAVRTLGGKRQQHIRLVGGIAQEITLENSNGAMKLPFEQGEVGIHDRVQLLLVCIFRTARMNHHMIFRNTVFHIIFKDFS